MKKLLMFIATEKGFTALRALALGGLREHVGCVVTFREVDVDKSWDNDIRMECEANHIPCVSWSQAKNNLIDIIQSHAITGSIAISWRYLLPLDINNYLEDKLIVFHDALLPKYRGFAPTPTAIMCGEENIGVTALYATDSVDQGEIVLQKSVHIPTDMYISEIIHAQSMLCADMLKTIVEKMEANSLTSYPQNEAEATYSIWRNVEDCHIDWNKSCKEIYDFIRALGSPYPGAFSYMDQKKIKIQRAAILPYDLNFAIRDAGKIWKISNNMPEIICGTGMLQIQNAVYKDGGTVEFNKVRCRLN